MLPKAAKCLVLSHCTTLAKTICNFSIFLANFNLLKLLIGCLIGKEETQKLTVADVYLNRQIGLISVKKYCARFQCNVHPSTIF